MSDNSKGVGWRTGSNCVFRGGTYHASESNSSTYNTCAAVTSSFTDFTYQATMQIDKGTSVVAGITFRGDDNAGKNYSLIFDPAGGFSIFMYSSSTAKPATLQQGDATSTGFKTGTGQSNDIGVVARGSSLTMYVNGKKLASVTDTTYSSGQIGTIVYDIGDAVDASFTNVKVWSLA
jgi:thiamine biosynthesis lipoprotein ApbE